MSDMKMLTIDLLKGKGVPVRSNPGKIVLTIIMLLVPLFILVIMTTCYLSGHINIVIKQQEIAKLEKNIGKLAEAKAIQDAYRKEKEDIDGCMGEVATNIGKHTQWTPILMEIVKNMPDSVFLTGIEVMQDSIKKSIPPKGGKGQAVEVSIPVKILRINVREKTRLGSGESIREFQDNLRASPIFSSQLDNIKVSQGIDTVKGQDTAIYQIDCTFKPKT